MSGRTVLTAAHVVAGAVSVVVRGPDKIEYPASTNPAYTGDADGPGPDLALVEIISAAVDVPTMTLAAVDRDSPVGDPVERCHAIGYPAFMERQTSDGARFRETADALGQVPALSGLAGGLLSVQVSNAPRSLPPAQMALGDSQWSGMSGGPVVADGCLLGVVTEHAPRGGDSVITATPLTALEHDPAHPIWGRGVTDPASWWARLGVAGAGALRRLPASIGRQSPAYWATVQEIRQRTGMLVGRHDELADIASFAAGEEDYRWLVGEAWAGKTSLLAEAVMTLPADVDVVCYFLSRREADADGSRFLAAVVPQLANLLDEDPPVAGLELFRQLWRRATEVADAACRHLLLVVDGLDEDLRAPGLPSVAALLPAYVGRNAHVLVTSRPHPELPEDIPAGHMLRKLRPVPLRPFSGAREQAVLARQEIDDLLTRHDDGLAADVLGLLTAAAGPLAVQDIAAMTVVAPQSAALTRRIRGLLTKSAARSLQTVGPGGADRYQFAHESLLAHARADDDLNDPEFRRRIHQWAESWRAVGWPTGEDSGENTPQYLLDSYPSTLSQDAQRLAQLASDIAWVKTAILSVGIDRVVADLGRAVAADPSDSAVKAVLASVVGQTHNLRPPQPLDQPDYILRQLWMQAAELGADDLAENIRSRLHSRSSPCVVPVWTTRRDSRALASELGRHVGWVAGIAVLSAGQVVTCGSDGQLLVWDPAAPGASPAELGRQHAWMEAVAVLLDGRVVTGGDDGQVLIWDSGQLGASPVVLGRHHSWVATVAVLRDGRIVTGHEDGQVLIWDPVFPGAAPAELGIHSGWARTATVLADGRVVTGGNDGRVLIWDPARPNTNPAELGRHDSPVRAAAVLADGRVVSGGNDGRVLIWDPARPNVNPTELGRHDGWVHAVAVATGGLVVTGHGDGLVLIWDPASPNTNPAELGRHGSRARAVAALADGRVVSGGDDGWVLIWDPARPGVSWSEAGRHHRWVEAVAVAVLADGRVVSGGDDGRVLIWDPAHPGAGPAELGTHNGWVAAVVVLADGRVVTGGNDGRVLIWNPAHPGAGPAELGRHDGLVRAVAVLADGRVVTGGNDGRVLIWNPAHPGAGPAELGTHNASVAAAAALADGRVVTGGNDGQVLIWNPAHPGAGPAELGRHDGLVRAVAVLADGRVVTGGDDKRVLIWDPARPGAGPAELGTHNASVAAAAVLADGRVVTGGDDEQIIVWDLTLATTQPVQLSCSVTALVSTRLGPAMSNLVIAHKGSGISLWSFSR